MEEKLTLLTESQIWGTHKEEKLDIFKKYGSECEITDLAIVTGATVYDYEKQNNRLINIHGFCWTKTIKDNNIICGYGYCNKKTLVSPFEEKAVIRPVLPIPDVLQNKIETDEIELGQYPQNIADKSVAAVLEILCYLNCLPVCSKTYMISDKQNDSGTTVYQYEGKKFIRTFVNIKKETCLSDGKYYQPRQYVWVEVSPVKWLVDKKAGLLISKKGLVSGVCFNHLLPENFENTNIKTFLGENMFEDLFSGLDFEIEQKGFQKTFK